MKNNNKRKELFLCKECNSTYKNLGELSKHINKVHFNSKIYYDKWILKKEENLCKICQNEAKYKGGLQGYKNYCSRQCAIEYNSRQRKKSYLKKFGSESPFGNKEVQNKSKQTCIKKYGIEHFTNPEKTKQTCLEKYGVNNGSKTQEAKEKIKNTHLKNYGIEYPMQLEENKEKSKQTCIKKYGVEYVLQSGDIKEKAKETMLKNYGVEYAAQNDKIYNKVIKTKKEKYGENFNQQFKEKAKQTCLKLYGDEHYNNREKYKETCLKKYNKNSYFETIEFKNKSKKTCIKKYGVPNVSQCARIHQKQQKSGFRIKKFKNTDLWYQGSYELDFLEKYYNNYIDIQRGPRIKYIFEERKRYYFSDFLIPSLNLVIECKNSYLVKRDKLILEKKKIATKNKGYNWIMIVDKNYKDFNDLISS